MIDIIVAFAALIALSPLILLSLIIVKLDSKGPIFFYQDRLGLNGKIFRVLKIRTMTDLKRIPNKEILHGDAEVTTVGAFLRRFKIDELPQLINVLKGDMSIVGPRPGLPSQKDEFDCNGIKRLLVRPGLTGLAQINGNIYLTWPERWKYDRNYVDNVSFLLDAKIILKTVRILLQGEQKFLKRPYA
jgi:lipopolysaccharide/colanic/teichoic acid biosynthesis glycosyltransferase